jgi:hypothetical protein
LAQTAAIGESGSNASLAATETCIIRASAVICRLSVGEELLSIVLKDGGKHKPDVQVLVVFGHGMAQEGGPDKRK